MVENSGAGTLKQCHLERNRGAENEDERSWEKP